MRVDRLLLVLVLVISSLAIAAESREATARKALTGPRGKTWVRVAMKVFLGEEKKCTQGETWLFRPNGQVHIDRCVAGKVEPEDKEWHLHSVSSLDMGLMVGSDDFYLLMPEIGNGTKKGTMVLLRPPWEKTKPTEQFEFRYAGR